MTENIVARDYGAVPTDPPTDMSGPLIEAITAAHEKGVHVQLEEGRYGFSRLVFLGDVKLLGVNSEGGTHLVYVGDQIEEPVGPCPECAQGKHQNCTIFVPEPNSENMVECPCMFAGHTT